MSKELSTLGITLKYCVETTAGTRPTTGYTQIHGIRSLPGFGSEPDAIESTPLEETDWKRYIKGLRDAGGSYGITVNDYDTFRSEWAACVSAYATGQSTGKDTWFEITVPGIASANKPSFFFNGEPIELGFNGAEVNSLLENMAYIIPNKTIGWATSST